MAYNRRRIKILIVDDSLTFRNMLNMELSKESDFEVVAFASDPYEARQKIMLFDPDVMILDVILPKMDGVEFVNHLMSQYPIPVVVISSVREYIVKAICAGAIDGVEKPQGGSIRGMSVFVSELAEKIRYARTQDTRRDRMEPEVSHEATRVRSVGRVNGASRLGQYAKPGLEAESSGHENIAIAAPAKKTDVAIIAIGASTGGTNAIADIMMALPAGLPGIVIVQHMPADFTGMFANRLHTTCAMPVHEAKSGDRIQPGTALVAPGSYHFRVVRTGDMYSALIQPGDKVNGHCPSVDVMFTSVAENMGGKAIGVLLTGMGQDGAYGLLAMRKAGAKTIGQDEKSSVVYGMPKVAYDIGAVAYQLPLNQIASKIVALL